MATIPDILKSGTNLPAQIESQQPGLPSLSQPLIQIANSLPAGPDLPITPMAMPPLPAMPTLGGLSLTPTPANPGQRALPTIPGATSVSILQPTLLQQGRGSL